MMPWGSERILQRRKDQHGAFGKFLALLFITLFVWADGLRGRNGPSGNVPAQDEKNMDLFKRIMQPGIGSALLSALLFGASAPAAKLLLHGISPVLLAGLLYLGSGIGLTLFNVWRRRRHGHEIVGLKRADIPRLAGAIFFGGIVGPILLMLGLSQSPASSASLLLNLEGVFTALIAWFIVRENFDTRIAIGMVSIVAGGMLLSWQGNAQFSIGSLFIIGACASWGIDNNVTQKISHADPVVIASMKGFVSGMVTTMIALTIGERHFAAGPAAGAMIVGFLGYGVSLVLFVSSLKYIGTARTGAYFSFAPFVGSALSIVIFSEPVTLLFLVSAVLMGIGLWFHLTERHTHYHVHEALDHEHKHVHDEHHQHAHPPGVDPKEPHTHPHHHEPIGHEHPHYPDLHHRHKH